MICRNKHVSLIHNSYLESFQLVYNVISKNQKSYSFSTRRYKIFREKNFSRIYVNRKTTLSFIFWFWWMNSKTIQGFIHSTKSFSRVYGFAPRFGLIVLPPLLVSFLSLFFALLSFILIPHFLPRTPSTTRERKRERERHQTLSNTSSEARREGVHTRSLCLDLGERVVCNKQWADSRRTHQLEYNRLGKLTRDTLLYHYLFLSILPRFSDSFSSSFSYTSLHWSLNEKIIYNSKQVRTSVGWPNIHSRVLYIQYVISHGAKQWSNENRLIKFQRFSTRI